MHIITCPSSVRLVADTLEVFLTLGFLQVDKCWRVEFLNFCCSLCSFHVLYRSEAKVTFEAFTKLAKRADDRGIKFRDVAFADS